MASKHPEPYRVFVASPGDVVPERKILFAVIEDLNRSWENINYPARLKCLSWEESIHADAGQPEDVIKEQIPFESPDIFIAIVWKRFGTPTSTINLEDGHPYLSGTQQEIEEIYDLRKKTGRPVFMLYRKDHDIPPDMTPEDLNQLKLLNDFLAQFKPGAKYPALYKQFKESEFGEVIKREVEQAVKRLVNSKKKARGGKKTEKGMLGSKKKKIPESAIPPVGRLVDLPVSDDRTETWLRAVKLKENPFLHQDAERDNSVPIYFTRFPDLRSVNINELTFERKSWFFFGNEGSGKTALRKFIASRGMSQKPDSDMVCIEYDQVEFENLLNNTDNISEFPSSFVQSIFNAVAQYTKNAIQSPKPPDSLRANLTSLSVELRKTGINWVLCLFDPGWASFEWKGSQVSTAKLITPLFPLSGVGGYGFRYFLPDTLKDELEPTFSNYPFNYIRVKDIRWDDRTLRDVLANRMTQLSVDQTAPYRSLGELCADEQNLSTLIDAEIASFAQGNPRAAVWLANSLIERHCEAYPTPPRITLETWNNVKWAWWLEKESQFLGISRPSGFRILSGRIYYQNQEVILPERSDRLLKALIKAEGSFCSKQELRQAGWPDEKNLAGISEKALSQALLRMKEEVKQELKDKRFKPFDCIKSVRGRGYRLVQTGTKQKVQEGRDDR